MLVIPVIPSTKPEWKSVTPGSIQVPDIPKKSAGWGIEKPPCEYFNWFWVLTSDWIDYLDAYANLVQTTADMNISITDETSFNKAIALLDVITNNNYTISITSSFGGGSLAFHKLIIKNIKGSGKIVWVNSVDLNIDRLELSNIENEVEFSVVGGVNDEINIGLQDSAEDDGLIVDNVRLVTAAKLNLYLLDNTAISTRKMIKVIKSVVLVHYMVFECVPNSGVSLYSPIYNEDSIFTVINIEVNSAIGAFTHGRSLATTYGSGKTTFTTPVWDMDPTTSIYYIPNYAKIIDYTLSINLITANVAYHIHALLEQLEQLDTDMYIYFTEPTVETFASDLGIDGVLGTGALYFYDMKITNNYKLDIRNFDPGLNFQTIDVIDTDVNTVPFRLVNVKDFFMHELIIEHDYSVVHKTVYVQNSKGHLNTLKLSNAVYAGSNTADNYDTFSIDDKSEVSIDTVEPDIPTTTTFYGILSVGGYSKLTVSTAYPGAGYAVKADIESLSMLLYNNASNVYTLGLDGAATLYRNV